RTVREVDVEEDEVGPALLGEAERLDRGVRLGDDGEALETLHVCPMDLGHAEVVFDDEDADHDARDPSAGRSAVKTAPPSLLTRSQPPRRCATWRASASPSPWCDVPVFVVKPSSKISSATAVPTPGPESRTRTPTPSGPAWTATSTHPPAPDEATASTALSTRLPTTVTRSRASAASAGRRVSPASRNSTPRSLAIEALASRRAASAGSPIRSCT